MVVKLILFTLGLGIGYFFAPKATETVHPEVRIVESCHQPPITIQCPDVKCDNSLIKQNLIQWVKFSKDLSEKLSACYDGREELSVLLKNQKDDTEYYRKKYVDFSCSE